jgi:hypothetical protein
LLSTINLGQKIVDKSKKIEYVGAGLGSFRRDLVAHIFWREEVKRRRS